MRAQMRAEIVKLHQRLQTTVIYVTADPIEAMTMSDRITLMNEGVAQQTGEPLVLYSEPVNLFVAGFLGSPPMNFVTGTLKEEGDQIRFREIQGGTIDVVFAAADRPAARDFSGKSIILGIRPENLEIAKSNRKEDRRATTAFPAIVEIVEPLGAETNLYLQTGAHTLVCRSRDALDHREAGHRFQFELKPGKAHLFDPASGNRLA
jgi:multiple sugar transport system ATP-binding protein